MRIAIPTDELTAPITELAVQVCESNGFTLVRAAEEECADMMLDNRVQVALLSPLAYGKATGVVDVCVVDATCVALDGFTNVAGVYFSHNAAIIETVGTEHPDRFLMHMGTILLKERYDAQHAVVSKTNSSDGTDCVVARITANAQATLDVSEEFTDMAECMLPAFMWVCRADVEMPALANILESMAAPTTTVQEVSEVVHLPNEQFTRGGRIVYRWSDEVGEGLNAVLNLLYFHQSLTVLPEIAIFNDPT